MDKNFVLQTKIAKMLFHDFAKDLPIIDYHCHLIPKEIANDIRFENISQIWLNGDHYKWRAMRANGIDEKYITGESSDWEKFEKWAYTVPFTLRNPLYHWTHLELQRYFGICDLLSPKTAKNIYEKTSEILKSQDYSARGLMRKMKVEVVCTTDDPIDNLEFHKKIASDGFEIKVLPAWRPDMVMNVSNLDIFNSYINKLADVSKINIEKFEDLLIALKNRQDYFLQNGCKLSDHGLENMYAEEYTDSEINRIFSKLRNHKTLDEIEIKKYKTAILYELCKMNHEKGWVQQFHIGPIRDNNTRFYNKIGPNTGFDSIGDLPIADAMSAFINRLDYEEKLTKTILYNINPAHNEVYATMTGNFQDGKTPGKIQFGSAWWFLDQKDGMEKQINALSNHGLLSRFIGMLTDSRSFLSYPRHEYFRRILCNIIGNDVKDGLLPNDKELLSKMVQDICYYNAKEYFNF